MHNRGKMAKIRIARSEIQILEFGTKRPRVRIPPLRQKSRVTLCGWPGFLFPKWQGSGHAACKAGGERAERQHSMLSGEAGREANESIETSNATAPREQCED